MSNLTTKQKIILGIIVCAMLIVIGIYGYISLNKEDELDISELTNIENVDGLLEEDHQNNEQLNSENVTNAREEGEASSEDVSPNSRTRQF